MENAEASDVGTQRVLTNRIVGGNQAAKGRYPYFVWWSRGCGASHIHDDIILTAAHCNVNKVRTNVIVSAYQMGNSTIKLKLVPSSSGSHTQTTVLELT